MPTRPPCCWRTPDSSGRLIRRRRRPRRTAITVTVCKARARTTPPAQMVGRTPPSAAGPLAGHHRRCPASQERVQGDPRGPGGPPHRMQANDLWRRRRLLWEIVTPPERGCYFAALLVTSSQQQEGSMSGTLIAGGLTTGRAPFVEEARVRDRSSIRPQ